MKFADSLCLGNNKHKDNQKCVRCIPLSHLANLYRKCEITDRIDNQFVFLPLIRSCINKKIEFKYEI